MGRALKDSAADDLQKLNEEVATMRAELTAHIVELRSLIAELQDLQGRLRAELPLVPGGSQKSN